MSEVRGCDIPEDLFYCVEKHVWIRREGEEPITVGMTDVAQNIAQALVAVTPKRAGKTVRRGKSVATVESGKWVGPVPAPVGGKIVEVNPLLAADPQVANRDPYGDGWIVKMEPVDWEGEGGELPTGESAISEYEAFLEAEGISCA